MTLQDIQDTTSQLVVTIPKTKTNQRRVFTVIEEMENDNVLQLFRKYVSLRPKKLNINKLYIAYRNGKCISQRVGIHSIGGIPKKIAEYLGLEKPELYTGHSFR